MKPGRVLPLLLSAALTAAAPQPARRTHPSEPSRARLWLQTLTLQQKVAQLVIVPFYGETPNVRSREYLRLARLVGETKVGGLILMNRMRDRAIQRAEPYALAAFLNCMQRMARIPLLVGGDFERGASMRVRETTPWPHAMTFAAARDLDATRAEGAATARESRALGVHWVMYPVADVNSNAENPVIHIRSYGEDAGEVAAHVRAFIEGAHGAGGASDPFRRVLTTVKHFPGHGDTSVDSHLNMPVITADRARLDQLELVPFRAAIRAGVDFVMTAHAAVPALEKPDVPATLSPEVLTVLLRKELGFHGMISTDALEMGGIVKGFGAGEAAVLAIEAGADILLTPPDPNVAIRAVVAAVRQGRIKESRINESVERVLASKVKLGLDRRRLVDVEAVAETIDDPDAAVRAQQVTDRGLTLIRNERHLLPLRPGERPCFVILTENRYGTQGAVLAEQLRKRAADAPRAALDPQMSWAEVSDAVQALGVCSQYVALAFAGATRYRDEQVLPGEFPRLLEMLTAGTAPVTLASLGQPYLIRSFPRVGAYLTTYTPAPPAEVSVVKALFGEMPVTGKLPVTIPGIAAYGEGLSLPPK